MTDGRFYSHYYGEDETPSRAFRVLSLDNSKADTDKIFYKNAEMIGVCET